MTADIPDWTDAVTVTGGTVVVGSGSVTIVGGQGGVDVSMDSPPLSVANVSAVVGATSVPINISMPTNATGLLVIPTQGQVGGGVNVTRVQVVGGTSGFAYADVTFQQFHPGPVFAPIAGDAENPLEVSVFLSSAATQAGVIAHCYAILATGIQQVYANPYEPLPVSMSATLLKRTASFNLNLANGGTSVVVPALAGSTVIVWAWQLMVMPSSGLVTPAYFSAQLQDTAGANTMGYAQLNVVSAAGGLSAPASNTYADGYPLVSVGRGLQVVAGSSVATQTTIVGTVQYSYR